MIPNMFHFVFGMRPDTFYLYQYLAVASAVYHNKPEQTIIHYAIQPSGEWWDALQSLPSVCFNHIEAPKEIYGNPLCCYAHQSDLVRLQALQHHGGVYLDIDTITLRDLEPLLGNEFVMAWQGTWGLCNAVMLSQKDSQFVNRWLEEYRYFRGVGPGKQYWDEHSVQLPAKLASLPSLQPHITILDDRAFFYPLWDKIAVLFRKPTLDGMQNSWVVHLWETASQDALRRISPSWLKSSRSFYAEQTKGLL